MIYEFIPETFSEQRHYAGYCDWWTSRKKTPPPAHLLPKTGIVVTLGGEAVVASFLYLANSQLCQIGFTAANPKSSVRKVLQAIAYALACLERIAFDAGVRTVHSFSDSSGLTRIMGNCGYRILSKHDCLMKDLGESNGN